MFTIQMLSQRTPRWNRTTIYSLGESRRVHWTIEAGEGLPALYRAVALASSYVSLPSLMAVRATRAPNGIRTRVSTFGGCHSAAELWARSGTMVPHVLLPYNFGGAR